MRGTRIGIVAAVLLWSAAAGADPATGWSFEVAPYVWTIGIHGDVTIRGVDLHIDKNFWDLLSNLDLAAEVHGEAWWQRRFGALLDTTFSKSTVHLDRGPANAKLQSWLLLTDAAGLARVLERQLSNPARTVWIDGKVGLRHLYTKGELDLAGGMQLEEARNAVDPILGGRIGVEASPVTLQVGGDIGGFHVSSNLTWSLAAWIEYRFSNLAGAVLGYRALAFDSETDSGANRFKYDILLHGFILAINFHL